jgi:hypothetical protein
MKILPKNNSIKQLLFWEGFVMCQAKQKFISELNACLHFFDGYYYTQSKLDNSV